MVTLALSFAAVGLAAVILGFSRLAGAAALGAVVLEAGVRVRVVLAPLRLAGV